MLKRDMSLWATVNATRSCLDAKLDTAHGRLEKTFLEGGNVLIAIAEILRRLIGSLDTLTGALDSQTTDDTINRIQATSRELAALPSFEIARHRGFEDLATICMKMRDSVEDMRETIRYLRTFAITVKITGAGLAEFDGFADEIRARIQSGADEVNRFAMDLATMHDKLAGARVFSSEISQNYSDVVPQIVHDLDHNACKVAEHHQNLASIAHEVKTLAHDIQGKIAAVLSALQIGDITRQRIEHIRSSFVLFEAFRESAEGQALDEDTITRVDGAISQLTAAQLEETFDDFQRECRTILANMARFVDDTRGVLTLRNSMKPQSEDGDGNFLSVLKVNVAAASGLVAGVSETSQHADSVGRSTSITARGLLQGIEVIRSIKTDIQYMALNSNLRCSNLGDEGRAVNVVSVGLRFFAEKLEAPADAVVAQLQNFEAAAETLSHGSSAGGADISRPLNEALVVIGEISGRMDENIREFELGGQEVFTRVSGAIATLDFESELGALLEDCVRTASELAELSTGDISDIAASVDGLSEQIYHIYTMLPEREIHRRYFPMKTPANAATSGQPESDEELFEDALF